jgi:O-antigen ligase
MTALKPLCRRISQFEWLILLAIFPAILFLTPGRAPILLLIPILWVIRWLGSGRFFPATPVNWPIHLLLIMTAVNLFATVNFENSLPMVGGLFFGIALFYALVSFGSQSRRHLYVLLAVFLVGGAGVTLLGLVHPTFLDRLPFFQSLLGILPPNLVTFPGDLDGFNANRLSGALLLFVPLTWVLAVTRLGGRTRGDIDTLPGWLSAVLTAVLFLLALLMSLALTFLFSRAAQVGFLAVMGLLFLLLAWNYRWLVPVALLALLAGGWLLASSEEYSLRVQQFVLTISGETTGGSTAVESFAGRTEVWERAYYIVRDFPITGIGMNNFPEVMMAFYPPIAFSNAGDITHAHNQMLVVGTDLGIPSMTAYAALILGIGMMLWQSWRQAEKRPEKFLALGLAASLLAYQLFGIFDGIGLGEKPAVFFWFLLGLSAALHRLSVKK